MGKDAINHSRKHSEERNLILSRPGGPYSWAKPEGLVNNQVVIIQFIGILILHFLKRLKFFQKKIIPY